MIDVKIETSGSTHAIYFEGEMVDFTTKYDEIEDMILEYCEEHDIDTWDINISEH